MSLNLLVFSMNASGHVNPQLPLAAELIRRGHQVTYVCGQPFQAAIEKTGARWIEGLPPFIIHKMNDDDPDRFKFFTGKLLEGGRANLDTFEQELREEKFDAILHGTFSLAGPILGELLGIPTIQLWPTFTPKPGTEVPIITMLQQSPEVIWKEIDEFFQENSATIYHPTETTRGYNISFVPQFFQPYTGEYPDNFYFIGPTMGERLNDHLWEVPADERPLIFISLGTVFNQKPEFFAQCIAALGDGKYQVAMSIGNALSRDDLPPVPENFTVAASFPQPKLLQSADIFLSHGGMNSSMEGVYNKVPFVLYPQMDEQESNSKKLVELGLGKLLTPDCTAEEIRTAIDEVYNSPRYKENAEKYGSLIRTAGGANRGASIVEDIVAQHSALSLST